MVLRICGIKIRSKTKKGVTLVEVMITVGIMAIIFGAILAFLVMSDNSWEIGRNKLVEQQQARIAIDDITDSLRLSSPDWADSAGGIYPVALGEARIDFYKPVFYSSCCPGSCTDGSVCVDGSGITHDSNDIKSLTKVTYKLNPDNLSQLLKKEGSSAAKVIAQNMDGISFSCGCSGCVAVDDACPFVDVSVTTLKETTCNVSSKVMLRNQNVTLEEEVEIEEPEEGEF